MQPFTRSTLLTTVGSLLLSASTLLADVKTIVIGNAELAVTYTTTGAEIQSIQHLPTKTEYLWQGDPAFWSGRAPNMFPVIVRLKGNYFTHQGTRYEMPDLGLAHLADFAIIADAGKNPQKMLMRFTSSEKTLAAYPFPFRLELAAEVSGLTLTQTYTVTNPGTKPLYFTLGGHPGLRTPFINGRGRADYEIRFSQPMQIDREEINGGLRMGKMIPFLRNEERLSLDDPRVPSTGMFLRNPTARQISLALKNQSPYVTVDLGDFPNTNIWTPPGMPYVCIEPLVTSHDSDDTQEAIAEKAHLLTLPPGESRTYRFSITIHPESGVKALN